MQVNGDGVALGCPDSVTADLEPAFAGVGGDLVEGVAVDGAAVIVPQS